MGFLLLAVQLYPLNMYLPYRRYVQKYRERKWKGLPEKGCKMKKTEKEASSVHIILNFKFIPLFSFFLSHPGQYLLA